MFTPSDVVDIKKIAMGGIEDQLAWNFTLDGMFTVKSAYHLRMSMNTVRTGQPKASSSVAKHRGYLALWETNAPGKVKIHMWFSQLLKEELGVMVASPPAHLTSQKALSSWLLEWLAASIDDEKELMLQATYGLWLARNNTREGRKLQQPHKIIDSLKVQLSDWKAANETRVSQLEPKTIQKWDPPVNGWVKINSDGAVSKQGTNGGGGAVFRDHNAAFLAGVSHFFPGIVDPEAVEALACRRAL
ncbi:WD repeat domain phosphoinositide-interacting protein 3 [Hordeum vulgare]|nr:WD repeat domain phosphoinositide-interacting protein 3 [Hordeum vulgare]